MTTWMVSIAPDFEQHWNIATTNGLWDTWSRNTAVPLEVGDLAYFRTTGPHGRLLGAVRLTTGQTPLTDEDSRPWLAKDTRTYRWRFRFDVAYSSPAIETSNRELNDNVRLGGANQNPVRAVLDPADADWLLGRMVDVPLGFTQEQATAADKLAEQQEALDPEADTRVTVLAAVKRRQGQRAFRQSLLRAYGSRCAVTGTGFEPLLEAAHIHPYRGPETNRIDNGLLLRSDIHMLFDLNLLTVRLEEDQYVIRCAPALNSTDYQRWNGLPLSRLPENRSERPLNEHLESHNALCKDWLQFA